MKFKDLTPYQQKQLIEICLLLSEPFEVLYEAIKPLIDILYDALNPIIEEVMKLFEDIDINEFRIYLWLEQRKKYFGW